eukprot:6348003-Pyramimonas_sp.AAC.1
MPVLILVPPPGGCGGEQMPILPGGRLHFTCIASSLIPPLSQGRPPLGWGGGSMAAALADSRVYCVSVRRRRRRSHAAGRG